MRQTTSLTAVILLSVACNGRIAPELRNDGRVASALAGTVAHVDLGAGATGSRAWDVSASGVVVGWRDGFATKWVDGAPLAVHSDSTRTSSAHRITATGDIVGWIPNSSGSWNLGLWFADGRAPRLIEEFPGFPNARVVANSNLQIAYQVTLGLNEKETVYFWSESTGPVNIGYLDQDPFPGDDTWVWAMNDVGQIVGASGVNGYRSHAFIWDGGTMTDLGAIGGDLYSSIARAINDNGDAAGHSWIGTRDIAVAWRSRVLVNLDPDGTESSDAVAINNGGAIVGFRTLAGETHATLWQDGATIDLGAGPGSKATHINDNGIIAGTRRDVATGREVPFFWESAAQGPVSATLPAGYATARITKLGSNHAVGYAYNTSIGEFATRAVVWPLTPPPPPTEPPPSTEQVDDLVGDVVDLESSGALSPGNAGSLTSKLDGARRQCERGNETAAGNQIRAFINHVRALIDSGRLTAAQGAALIAEAEGILAGLDC